MTPLLTLQLIAVICTLSALAFWVLCHCARPGWEDEDGFHEGHEHTDFDGE